MFEEISSRSKYDLIVEIASILANNSVDVNELDDIFDGVKAYLPETVWEDGTNPRIILKHYGEKEVGHLAYGFWKNDGSVLEKIKQLPEILDPEEKVRIKFFYDPDFPRTLIIIQGVKGVQANMQ